MSSQTRFGDFAEQVEQGDQAEPVAGQDAVSAASWRPEGPRCQCGARLAEFSSTARARQQARAYGDEDGVVRACPACTDPTSGEDAIHTVPKAIAHSDDTSSVEPMSREELLASKIEEANR